MAVIGWFPRVPALRRLDLLQQLATATDRAVADVRRLPHCLFVARAHKQQRIAVGLEGEGDWKRTNSLPAGRRAPARHCVDRPRSRLTPSRPVRRMKGRPHDHPVLGRFVLM